MYRNFKIGDYTYGAPELLWWTQDCEIGKFCSIARGVKIFGGGEHRPDWVTTYPFSGLPQIYPWAAHIKGHPATKGPTKLGNDIWIGNGATILSGVTVGSGAIIGAGSLVTKNVPPYSIVAGNPARLIRYRFSEIYIEKLLEISWWDMDINIIVENIDIILSNDIDNFIKKFQLLKKIK